MRRRWRWSVPTVFAFFNAVTGNLTAVYPIEVFPTDVRATGVASLTRSAGSGLRWTRPAPGRERSHRPAVVHGDRSGVVRDRRRVSQLLAPEITGKSLSHTGVVAPLVPGIAPA
ncbi:MAG: hypothetical protein M3143_00785 [Actinomycetota bacterium]|nr:hypothetical protein [Actinomycetota bacterium]